MALIFDLKVFINVLVNFIISTDHNITTPCSFVEAFLTTCRSDIVGCNDEITSFM